MAARHDRLISRGSCPVLHNARLRSEDDERVADALLSKPLPQAKEGLHEANDWFKDHIATVGAPRPERPGRQEVHEGSCERSEAMQQVEFMAERYRAEMEAERTHMAARKLGRHMARSSPDLTTTEAGIEEPDKPNLSSCPSCTGWCSSVKLLEDAWRKFRAARSGDGGAADGGTGAALRESSLIIFDWDDTLLPTTFILQTVLPSIPPKERDGPVPKTSRYYEELVAHAHTVGFVLRVARRVARVAIVTNSLSPWVVAAAQRYLPGLDLDALLNELQIPVYYARRHVAGLSKMMTWHEERLSIEIDHRENTRIGLDILPADANGAIRIARIDQPGLIHQWNMENKNHQVLPGDWIVEVNGSTSDLAQRCRKLEVLAIKLRREVPDRDPFIEAKRIDMEACVCKFFRDPGRRANVISIGDSLAEQIAVKEVLPRSGRPSSDPLCKTVSLLLRPSIHQLGNELKILLVWLSYMVEYDKDFDLAMDNLDALEKKLFKR